MSNGIEVDTIRPMGSDVLLRHVDMNKMKGGVILIHENTDEYTTQYFEILKVGSKVKHVNVGDIVLVPWGRITPPFEVQNSGRDLKVGITDEKEILAIVDQD